MTVTVEQRVNFFDTDAMGVIHHANYIRWFEIGRVAYLRACGIELMELMQDGILFPITDVRARYVAPGHFDEVLCIETRERALTKAKMTFDYRIYRKSDGETLMTGYTQNVFTSVETGHVTRLPLAYYERLQAGSRGEAEGGETA